jgi:hypothetical protein
VTNAVQVGARIGLEDLDAVARRGRGAELAGEAVSAIEASRRAVDDIIGQRNEAPRVYGVNTGFGALSETRIAPDDVRALQRNLVRSHSTGVGPDLTFRVSGCVRPGVLRTHPPGSGSAQARTSSTTRRSSTTSSSPAARLELGRASAPATPTSAIRPVSARELELWGLRRVRVCAERRRSAFLALKRDS